MAFRKGDRVVVVTHPRRGVETAEAGRVLAVSASTVEVETGCRWYRFPLAELRGGGYSLVAESEWAGAVAGAPGPLDFSGGG